MVTLLFLLVIPLCAATPAVLNRLGAFISDGTGYHMDVPAPAVPQESWAPAVLEPYGGWTALGDLPAPRNQPFQMGRTAPMDGLSFNGGQQPMGGSFTQAGLSLGGVASLMNGNSPFGEQFQAGRPSPMSNLFSAQSNGAPKPEGIGQAGSPMGDISPVGVAADFSFGGQMDSIHTNNPDMPGLYDSVPHSGFQQMPAGGRDTGAHPAKNLHFQDFSQGTGSSSPHQPAKIEITKQWDSLLPKAKPGFQSMPPHGLKSIPNQRGGNGQQGQKPPQPSPPLPPPAPVRPPTAAELLMSNLFVTGVEKSGVQKQFVPEPVMPVGGPRGLGPIPGLTGPSGTTSTKTASTERGAPCDLYVDAVFVMDRMDKLWLARESIRFYETQLMPSRKARFGVVLCGQRKSFYTALHLHFSALLASLEDLQHANATLEPTQHMPDTPGYRSDNNPYPPRVSEDFAQADAGCLETAYHLLAYQSKENSERLLAVVGTKERWADPIIADEARFLHSLNITILALADSRLSPRAQNSMRNMASSLDKFRFINDNVTLHALPAMVGNAVCRPQKADVTVAVQRTSTSQTQEPEIINCRRIDAISLERTLDFGRFFGTHKERVRCEAGQIPDPYLCACV